MESRALLTLSIDTSVIGGCFDAEFEKENKKLFKNSKLGKYEIMVSSVTEDELLTAPEQVRKWIKTMPEKFIKKLG